MAADGIKNEATDFLNSVIDMAKRVGIPEDKVDAYVHEHMTGAGYKMVPTYVKPEGEGGSKSLFGWSSGSGSEDSSTRAGSGSSWFK